MIFPRNNTIDIAKGIGITLVVLGHNWITLNDKGTLFRIIFSFHMPLFFFTSGIFLKEVEPLKPFVLAKVDSLLKPYLVVLVFVAIGDMLFHQPLWVKHLFGIAYGTGITLSWEALWFLPHLFITLIFSRLILNITAKFNYKLMWRIAIATCMLIIGATFIDLFWLVDLSNFSFKNIIFDNMKYLPGLPFSLDLLWVSSAYVVMGFLLRQAIESLRFNSLIFFIAILTFATLHYYFHKTIDLNLRVYGNVPISSLKAILGIYIVISIAKLLNTFTIPKKILAYLGANSLFILIFHGPLQLAAFDLLSLLGRVDYLNGLLAFLIGTFMPMLLLEITKRQRILSKMLLPKKLAILNI